MFTSEWLTEDNEGNEEEIRTLKKVVSPLSRKPSHGLGLLPLPLK